MTIYASGGKINPMKNTDKYKTTYYLPPEECLEWTKKSYIDKAPIWCSVDLRDGNQALATPMNLDEKIEFFKLLCKIGFKEIEIGFPAASETEYTFARALIEKNLIPDDVTVQVLTQARPHIIQKTFEAIKGAKKAVVHLYNSTSLAQREQVFKMSKEDIKQLAVDGAKQLLDYAETTDGNFLFEYSPESFHATENDFALDVCNAVLDVWKDRDKIIINLPATVENSMPHVFASRVEYFGKNLKYRDKVILSLHPHNDRGSAVATAEMGILAGADRIEGTLFGNGERTGNVDIVTLAMNMYAQGIEPNLDFSHMPEICDTYERLTGMEINPRQPYAGDLVFVAFSGSHQDAIAKGIDWHDKHKEEPWNVPYLPIDPHDVGRLYESGVIRINSQSGKGGVSYVLRSKYGINLPKRMKEEVGYHIKDESDREHRELSPEWIYEIFERDYIRFHPNIKFRDWKYKQTADGSEAEIIVKYKGEEKTIHGKGNGPLDAINNAVKECLNEDYVLAVYEEHALEKGASANAVAYVGLLKNDKMYWGCGIDPDIIRASAYALGVAVNKLI